MRLIYRWRREQPISSAAAQLVAVRIASESPPCIAPVPPQRVEPQIAGGAGSRLRSNLSALRRVIAALGDDGPWAGRPHLGRGFDGLAAVVQHHDPVIRHGSSGNGRRRPLRVLRVHRGVLRRAPPAVFAR